MEDVYKELWVCPVHFDSVYRISENQIAIDAHSTEVIGLNEDSVQIDSVYRIRKRENQAFFIHS